MAQFHEDAAVVGAWQRAAGPALVWLTPGRRRMLLLVGAAIVLLQRPAGMILETRAPGAPGKALIPVSVLLALVFVWLCFQAARNFASLPLAIRRRPQLALHSLLWLLLAGIWLTAGSTGAWHSVMVGLAVILPFLMWRCGYMLLSAQRGRIAGTRFRDHLIYLFPPWGGSATPYGKGLDYLSRCEARNENELARSQLAGFKLLLLSLLWNICAAAMDRVVYADPTPAAARDFTLGVPHLEHLIADGGRGSAVLSWVSVYCELFQQVFQHAARGHSIIGVLRLFGFNVFRNTYKPLLAESIVEFWNRYYYYFKELLVNFFFLPTFARWFRKWNRTLRLFLAVFAAAFVGNMYYHLLQRHDRARRGRRFAGAVGRFVPAIFYCLLLALGIFVSMRREQAQRRPAAPADAAHGRSRILGVWTFFA